MLYNIYVYIHCIVISIKNVYTIIFLLYFDYLYYNIKIIITYLYTNILIHFYIDI